MKLFQKFKIRTAAVVGSLLSNRWDVKDPLPIRCCLRLLGVASSRSLVPQLWREFQLSAFVLRTVTDHEPSVGTLLGAGAAAHGVARALPGVSS